MLTGRRQDRSGDAQTQQPSKPDHPTTPGIIQHAGAKVHHCSPLHNRAMDRGTGAIGQSPAQQSGAPRISSWLPRTPGICYFPPKERFCSAA